MSESKNVVEIEAGPAGKTDDLSLVELRDSRFVCPVCGQNEMSFMGSNRVDSDDTYLEYRCHHCNAEPLLCIHTHETEFCYMYWISVSSQIGTEVVEHLRQDAQNLLQRAKVEEALTRKHNITHVWPPLRPSLL